MGAQSSADARITAERRERKYTISRDRAKELASALDRVLARHRFTGIGANRLPGAQHFVTTIYFDTPDQEVYRTAIHGERNLKIRAKEYYDLHPSLTPLATDPSELVRYRPVLWLELKERDGVVTTKRRIAVPKAGVSMFLTSGTITPEMIALQEDAGALPTLARVCRNFGSALAADCLVNYRRLAWQTAHSDLRITLDVGLTFFRPPADLWTRTHALVRESLGPPVGEEPCAVIEVKSLDDPPGDVTAILADLGAVERGYSKFEHAARTVHG